MRLQELVIDCADPARLAEFWGTLLGARWGVRDEAWAAVDADPLLLGFQRVPEPKSSPKNRLHLDVLADDGRAAAGRAVELGARVVSDGEFGEDGDGYVVLADPEDNEFCFVVDNHDRWRSSIDAAMTEGARATGRVPA